MGPNSVNHWYDVPRIRRKEYEHMERVARNRNRHDEANKTKNEYRKEDKVNVA